MNDTFAVVERQVWFDTIPHGTRTDLVNPLLTYSSFTPEQMDSPNNGQVSLSGVVFLENKFQTMRRCDKWLGEGTRVGRSSQSANLANNKLTRIVHFALFAPSKALFDHKLSNLRIHCFV